MTKLQDKRPDTIIFDEFLREPTHWDNFKFWFRWTLIPWFRYIFRGHHDTCYECNARLSFREWHETGLCYACCFKNSEDLS